MDVIFTPVFRDTKYLHHICSECSHKITLDQSVWGGVYFGDTQDIKFCPRCGNPVVRFAEKAIFETPIDYEPLRPFYEAHEEYERKCRWLYHCYISEERQEKIVDLMPFAKQDSGWVLIASKAVQSATRFTTDWRKIKKLKAEFGEDKEAQNI